MKNLLFVSEKKHFTSEFIGGVQVCTKEFYNLLSKSGFNNIVFEISHNKDILTRLRIKLGIDVYNRYNFKRYIDKISKIINENKINYIALNQVDLLELAPILKRINSNIKIIVLSHGNESGDFLHEIIRNKLGLFKRWLKKIRLGFVIYKEAYFFLNYIDYVFVISNTELEINNWLGAKKQLFIPRSFFPDFIKWKPDKFKVGFVGTLNHKPNYDGLVSILKEIKNRGISNIKVAVVGRPEDIGAKLSREYSFVEYKGYLDDGQIKNEISTWNIFINPIFWFSRGASTKLAQGINYGVPVISTNAGNRGYEFDTDMIPSVDNPSEMVDKIVYFLNNEEKLKTLSDNVKYVALNSLKIENYADTVKYVLNL